MPRNQVGTVNDKPTASVAGAASAQRAPIARPSRLVAESIRKELVRLEELREMLEYAEVEAGEQETLWLQQSDGLERSRRRHIARLGRFRKLRNDFRATEAAKLTESSGVESELNDLRAQLTQTMAMLESARDSSAISAGEHQTEIESLREQLQLAVGKAAASEQQLSEWETRYQHVSSELDQACEQIIALESQLQAGQAGSETSAFQEELRSQIEELTRSCRELESENANLASEIADLRVRAASASHAAPQAVESMTWEQRKAAILEQLRQEDMGQGGASGETKSLREMIERTSEEVARRDQEIAELRELLDQQSATFRAHSANEEVAIGAAGIAMMFDSDELICEERDRLKEVQAEWDAKLRQAEVELSLERAKLARERRDLETKQSELEDKLKQIARDHDSGLRPDDGKAPRRRWLTQLGLGDGS